MDIDATHKLLHRCNRQGRRIYTRRDRALGKGLTRLVAKGLLERVCCGMYVNPLGAKQDSRIAECIAVAMRRGEYNHLSLESALSEYGAMSTAPFRSSPLTGLLS